MMSDRPLCIGSDPRFRQDSFAIDSERVGLSLLINVSGWFTSTAAATVRALAMQEWARRPFGVLVLDMRHITDGVSDANWDAQARRSVGTALQDVPVVYVVNASLRPIQLRRCQGMESYGLLGLTTDSISAALQWAVLQSAFELGRPVGSAPLQCEDDR